MDCGAQVQVMIASHASARDRTVVPLASTERADWCIIARFSRDANGPMITNLNEVTDSEPHVGS
jgi:hypothetical protein